MVLNKSYTKILISNDTLKSLNQLSNLHKVTLFEVEDSLSGNLNSTFFDNVDDVVRYIDGQDYQTITHAFI